MNNKILPIKEGSKSENEAKEWEEWEEWEKGFRAFIALPLAGRWAAINDGDIEILKKEMMDREGRETDYLVITYQARQVIGNDSKERINASY